MKFSEDYIPYSSHVSSSVVSTKSNGWVLGLRAQGISFETKSDKYLYDEANKIHKCLMAIHETGLTVTHQVVRRNTTEYPGGEGNTKFSKLFMSSYKDGFDIENKGLLVNELYIFLHYHPYTKLDKPKLNSTGDVEALHEHAIKVLNDKVSIIKGALCGKGGDYDIEVLEVEKRGDEYFSPLMEILSYTINGFWTPIPAFPRGRLAGVMPISRATYAKTGGRLMLEYMNKRRFVALLEVYDYPDWPTAKIMDGLLSLPFEMNIVNSFSCVLKGSAKTYLKRQRDHLKKSGDSAVSQIKLLEKALDDISSGKTQMGLHHCVIAIYADSPQEVIDAAGEVIGPMATNLVVVKPLGMAVEAAFWSMLPGNENYRPRPSAITTDNFAAFCPLHNFLTGKLKGNPLGDPVAMFATTSKSPHYFSFHVSSKDDDDEGSRPPGHTLLTGATGEGKTTLLAGLLTHADKFKPRMMICDKDRGLQAWTLAMDGHYTEIEPGKKTGWNPFYCQGTAAQRAHCKDLIVLMATCHGETVNHQDMREIDKAISVVFEDVPLAHRSLEAILDNVPSHDSDERASLRERLLRWSSGPLSWVFSSGPDALDLKENRIFGFDFTHVLDMPEVRQVVLAYLLSRSLEMIDGITPMFLSVDEYWKFDRDPWFADFIKDFLLTKRKEGGVLVLSTQNPQVAIQSAINDTLMTQIVTKIIMRDPSGSTATYVDGMGLTLAEFNVLKSFGSSERKFLVTQGSNSCVCVYNLSHAKDYITVLSGDKIRGEIAKEARRICGNDLEKWLPYYIERANNRELINA